MRQTNDDQDRALLARIAQGDMVAMKALYTAHSGAVTAFVRRQLHDEFAAADVVQETMLSVWRGAAGYEGRSTVRSWILSLARNKAVDHIRKTARITLGEPDDTIPDDAPDPENVLRATQDAQRVRDCVTGLSDRHRAVVHLAFFEELSYPEIARIEDVPTGTVKTRIHHAKKLLMRCLGRDAV